MISRGAVNRNPRAGRIVGDHSANRRARTGSNVRTKTKTVRPEEIVELIQNHACPNADRTFVDIEIVDLSIVAREIDNQTFADCVSNQTGARTAGSDRNIFIGGCFNDRACLLRAGWKGDAERLDLVNRSVSGVELAGQIIEPHVATRGAEFLLGGGGNHWSNLSQGRTARTQLAGEMLSVTPSSEHHAESQD